MVIWAVVSIIVIVIWMAITAIQRLNKRITAHEEWAKRRNRE